MTSEDRRAQLEAAAMEELATAGYEGLTLEAVAARAGVTRNLLYHYFPEGRLDLLRAAVERAGQELTEDWSVDPDVPLDQRVAANFARLVDHAARPTAAWAARRAAASSGDAKARATSERYTRLVVDMVAENNLGTRDPSPLARATLEAYVAFAESLLDAMRERGLPREEVMRVLTEQLAAVVQAVQA